MTETKTILLALGAVGVAAGATVLGLYLARRRASGDSTKPMLGAGKVPEAEERIGRLQDTVWDAVRDPNMRELSLAVTGPGQRIVTVGRRKMTVTGAGCEARDADCETEAVNQWSRANSGIAASLTPAGEDSQIALTCSLLTLNGITCRFRAAKRPSEEPTIFTLAGFPKNSPSRWVSLDSDLAGRLGAGTQFEDFDG